MVGVNCKLQQYVRGKCSNRLLASRIKELSHNINSSGTFIKGSYYFFKKRKIKVGIGNEALLKSVQ